MQKCMASGYDFNLASLQGNPTRHKAILTGRNAQQ